MKRGFIMTKIAEFYGFEVFVDSTFSGEPQVVVNYNEDGLEGHYDIINNKFTDIVFPKYLFDVINEWISDNIQLLKQMWADKKIITVPNWE